MLMILEFTSGNMKQIKKKFFLWCSKKHSVKQVFLCSRTQLICNWVYLRSTYFCLCEPLEMYDSKCLGTVGKLIC